MRKEEQLRGSLSHRNTSSDYEKNLLWSKPNEPINMEEEKGSKPPPFRLLCTLNLLAQGSSRSRTRTSRHLSFSRGSIASEVLVVSLPAHKESPEPTRRRQMASHLIRFQDDNAAPETGRRPAPPCARLC